MHCHYNPHFIIPQYCCWFWFAVERSKSHHFVLRGSPFVFTWCHEYKIVRLVATSSARFIPFFLFIRTTVNVKWQHHILWCECVLIFPINLCVVIYLAYMHSASNSCQHNLQTDFYDCDSNFSFSLGCKIWIEIKMEQLFSSDWAKERVDESWPDSVYCLDSLTFFMSKFVRIFSFVVVVVCDNFLAAWKFCERKRLVT